MERVLLVEDTPSLRDVLKMVLEHEGYQVEACKDAENAIHSVATNNYSLILSDFKLPGMNGIEFLREAREKSPTIPFLMMTAFGSIDVAVEAMKFGANDFICKPFEPDQLCSVVRNMVDQQKIIEKTLNRQTRKKRKFLTEDPKLKELLENAKKAAKFDTPVLILGESGTGKELVARHIHEHSVRKDEKFVSINCAAIPHQLLESEFFGHEAGSFTGATQCRQGLFEVASKGTIFLDEIGDMPQHLQVKLLRALQEGEIRRVGSNHNIKVNPRILAATNKTVDFGMEDSCLREDFYYRLAVLTVNIPPLRERKGDTEKLIKYFVEDFSENIARKAPQIDEQAWEILLRYPWPGNVRELENVIERAVLLCPEILSAEHLGINLDINFDTIEDIISTLPEVAEKASRIAETDQIHKILQRVSGNKSKAAEILGVSYKTLLNKIKEYQIH